MVMQAISVCCVKVPCESVLESLVSIFDNHFNAIRNMNKESTTQDFMIAMFPKAHLDKDATRCISFNANVSNPLKCCCILPA